MGAAACYAVLHAALNGKPGPVIFAGVLTLGLAVVWFTVRRGKRHVRGVYASAALFALVHSAIWPSPIPLFVLGLGLGWLAVRTRGFLAPAIVHGLFNAVSAVFVLRGGAV
jgi:membrane protease YdiL (CAAX protease family)